MNNVCKTSRPFKVLLIHPLLLWGRSRGTLSWSNYQIGHLCSTLLYFSSNFPIIQPKSDFLLILQGGRPYRKVLEAVSRSRKLSLSIKWRRTSRNRYLRPFGVDHENDLKNAVEPLETDIEDTSE